MTRGNTRPPNAYGRATVQASMLPATHERLLEVARECGMPPGRLAGELLDELMPTVSGVRRRLQVIKTSERTA